MPSSRPSEQPAKYPHGSVDPKMVDEADGFGVDVDEMGIAARFEGKCGLCQERIFVDDLIREYEGEWCHADCVAEEER